MPDNREFPLRYELSDATLLNRRLVEEFQACKASADIRRSHYFEGRYENLYVTLKEMPSLEQVLQEAKTIVAGHLGCLPDELSVGYWMNAMEPGHVTLPHTHDDDDEALSGVYYLAVPEASGDFVMRHPDGEQSVISPAAGLMMFFPPDWEHEVRRHEGEGLRLSLGMNFGFRRTDDD